MSSFGDSGSFFKPVLRGGTFSFLFISPIGAAGEIEIGQPGFRIVSVTDQSMFWAHAIRCLSVRLLIVKVGMIIFLQLITLSGMAMEHPLAVLRILGRHWGDQDLNKNRTLACFLKKAEFSG